MALQTKVIKQKISSVKNVQKVTKTMELISVAKMRKAVEKKKESEHYGYYILETLVRLAAQRHLDHPLFTARSTGKRLLVLYTSDRGLCGQFHTRIDRRVRQFLENHPGEPVACVTIGKHAERIAKRHKIEVAYRVEGDVEKMGTHEMRELADWITAQYSNTTTYRSISCIFNQFENAMLYSAVRTKILPIDEELLSEIFEADRAQEIARGKQYHYMVEPNEDSVLDELLPELLAITLHQFLLDSAAAEHSARMVAMRRASDNAGRLKDTLVREYNRARQEAVTKEIIEIINTAGAL